MSDPRSGDSENPELEDLPEQDYDHIQEGDDSEPYSELQEAQFDTFEKSAESEDTSSDREDAD